MNVHTGEVKPWDQLSEHEKLSGEWIPVTEMQAAELRALVTRLEDIRRVPLAPVHELSGLPRDAKPQAHRRAIAQRKAEHEAVLLTMKEQRIAEAIRDSQPTDEPEAVVHFARGIVDDVEPGDVLRALGGTACEPVDIPALPRAAILEPEPGDVLEAAGGVRGIPVASLLAATFPAFRGESIEESEAREAMGLSSVRTR